MAVQKLNQRQIFGMKRNTLESRIESYFAETGDFSSVLQYLIAIFVRNRLTIGDYSLMCAEAVQQIFLNTEPCAELRQFLPFFQSYFKIEEYQKIITSLFPNKEKYYEETQQARDLAKRYSKNIKIITEEGCSRTLKSVFKDASGKRHTWSLRDFNPSNTIEETRELLKILNSLTIFKTDNGVRRFIQLIKFDTVKTTPETHYVEPLEELEEVDNGSAQKIDQAAAPSMDQEIINLVSLQEKTLQDYVAELEAMENLDITLPADKDLDELSESDFYDLIRTNLPDGQNIPDEAFKIAFAGLKLTAVEELQDSETTASSDPIKSAPQQAESTKEKTKDSNPLSYKEVERRLNEQKRQKKAERRLRNEAQKKQAKEGNKSAKKKRKKRGRK